MKRGKTEKWEEEEQDEEQVPLKISDSHTVYGSGAGAPPIAAAEEEEVRYAKWASVRKRVLALVALPALLPPITSTMYLPTINVVITELETTEDMVALTLSAYALTVGFCPLLWGPLSDHYGRRIVLLACLSIFIVSAIIAGCAQDIYTLILARIMQAMGLSAAGTVGTGSIADVYPPAIRGNAMGLYSVTVLLGTVLGPVIGGNLSGLSLDLWDNYWAGGPSSGRWAVLRSSWL